MRSICYTYSFLLTICIACNGDALNEGTQSDTEEKIVNQALLVKTDSVKKRTFAAKIISNGKMATSQEIQLYFQSAGVLNEIFARNGADVARGELLASICNEAQKLAVAEATLQLNESKVEIDDQLITQGGKKGDSTSVSAEVYDYIKFKSGYNRAVLALQKANFELSKTFLYAPTSGTVANLFTARYNVVSTTDPFCTLISKSDILVRCTILESELSMVAIGQRATIIPTSMPSGSYNAVVESVNPVVTSHGLVDLTLKVISPDKRLLTGMNVQVQITKSFDNQIVVPKTAVVERNGRKVVFTYEKGAAKWNYVNVGQENDTELVISAGIQEGQELIVSGNTNLGHGTPVRKEDDTLR